MLRRASGGNYYRLSIDNSSDWMYLHRLGGGDFLGQQRTRTDAIDTSPGGKNLLQVVMRDDRAWVYINGAYQGFFDMTADTLGDWIRLFVSDRRTGTTEFTDFAVWRLDPSMYRDFPELNPGYIPPPTPTSTPTPTPNPAIPLFGPESGSIFHDESADFIKVYRGPRIDGDVMIDATIVVPFEPRKSSWNFGFFLISFDPGGAHLVEVSSKFGGSYNHWRRSAPGEEWRGRNTEDVIGLHLEKGERNRIQLIVIGDSGHLYINNRRAGILNLGLGNMPSPEWVYLAVIDRDSQGYDYSRGSYTKFEDFTVWRWHESLFDLPEED